MTKKIKRTSRMDLKVETSIYVVGSTNKSTNQWTI